MTNLTEAELQDALINTKAPLIFAESAVSGDGSDWNLTELGILGDISIAVPVTIFDNDLHYNPAPHVEPFAATLVFTPGALLRNGQGQPPADWAETTTDGALFGLVNDALLEPSSPPTCRALISMPSTTRCFASTVLRPVISATICFDTSERSHR